MNPDREALLRDAQPFVEARHEQRVQGFVVGLSEDAALECLDIIERLAIALREEMGENAKLRAGRRKGLERAFYQGVAAGQGFQIEDPDDILDAIETELEDGR